MIDAGVICERLASLGRSGYPVRAALVHLGERFETTDPAIDAVARRARLGGSLAICLAPLSEHFGDQLPRLQACLEASSTSGADWAHALDALAGSIRDRAAAGRSASVSTAGATLSARIVAGLPLLTLPLALRQLTDPAVAMSVCLGVLLGSVGYVWLKRAIPTPPPEDVDAAVADEVVGSLRAGASLHEALTRAVSSRSRLSRSLRRAQLGSTWSSAVSDELPHLAEALRDAEGMGVPVADALARRAACVRMDANHVFERKVQRAPVKMVVPLVCCVLPSFVLVAIVPLLRGLAHPV